MTPRPVGKGLLKAPEPREEVAESPDLMAALEQTLAEMRGSGKRQKQEA